MTVQREAVPGNDRSTRRSAPGPDQPDPPPAAPVSRATVFCYALAGVVLVGWFIFGALVLRQGVIDSAGESLGTGFALLLLVSIVGTVRRSRRAAASPTSRPGPPR